MPRYLRFVQALCLGSSLMAGGCTDDAGPEKPKDASADAPAGGQDAVEAGAEVKDVAMDMAPETSKADIIEAASEVRPVPVDGPLPPPNLPARVAVARLVDALEQSEAPFIRHATRAILADEVMHGQFGFLYLEAQRAQLDGRPETRESLTDYLHHAFAVLEHEMVGMLDLSSRPPAAARGLGVIDPVRARGIFFTTMDQAIVPGLERFGIRARAAWNGRRRRA
ncbi:MAG TPA: hypothetical protein VGG33_23675 [Polyangia bacterium]